MNKSYLNFRTDMADERVDTYKRVHNLSKVDGIKVENKQSGKINTTIVDVLNENGKAAVGKELGKYITIEVQDIEYLEEAEKENLITELSNNLETLVDSVLDKSENKSILIVGLGNEYVTPDALGPKVVSYIDITRHLFKYAKEYLEPETKEISGISPGVLGTTGIETSEIITSIVNKISPNLVIVIDSLASMSVARVGRTIQLSNTGITPGAGVGNEREGLNKDTLGIPTIAVGVPTVVDMATITNEAIDKLTEKIKKEATEYTNHGIDVDKLSEVFELFEKDGRYSMIANVLDTENYIVTPKEIDGVIAKISEIIASGINTALRPKQSV